VCLASTHQPPPPAAVSLPTKSSNSMLLTMVWVDQRPQLPVNSLIGVKDLTQDHPPGLVFSELSVVATNPAPDQILRFPISDRLTTTLRVHHPLPRVGVNYLLNKGRTHPRDRDLGSHRKLGLMSPPSARWHGNLEVPRQVLVEA
jgi:hypothetical protein